MTNPRCIGRVKHVRGATVTVSLDRDLVGVTPLWEGRPYPVGQVGSLVVLPQGPTSLLAAVTLVGIAELTGHLEPSSTVQVGDRWLQVQLLGELDSMGEFHRGVSTYPGLDDPVHFTIPADLKNVFPAPSSHYVRIGGLVAAPGVPLTLDAPKLVTRHSAIVGSTGSGKTSAVASLIQNLVSGGWTAANVVVIDPHGEYADAFDESASVRSVGGDANDLLRVPYWALPSNDILGVLCGGSLGKTVENRFQELVLEARREFASEAEWMDLPSEKITSDSPIPFDIHRVWFELDYENNATYSEPNGNGEAEIAEEGDPETLRPTRFHTHGLGATPPFKGPRAGHYALAPGRMRTTLADPLMRFLVNPKGRPDGSDPLVEVIQEWLGGVKPVSVLDFSGVPNEVTDLAVGVVLQLIFELAVRSDEDGIGRPRPVLVVLEEAHRYMSDQASTTTARRSANRIAREGRKYGVGLMLITQRPSELPDTALSQVGTLMALRLTNGSDQARVRSALPDAVAGLADSLPALRTGEAIVAGEAVTLPTRVHFDLPSPQPRASDPTLESWRREPTINDVGRAVKIWRGDQLEVDNDRVD